MENALNSFKMAKAMGWSAEENPFCFLFQAQ
jgi:hypothetical protein